MRREETRDKLVFPVAGVTLLGWMVALIYAVLTNQYVPLTIATPVMLLLAGWVFGSSVVRSVTVQHDADE